MFLQIVPEFINQVPSPVLPASLLKTEAPAVIKNEPSESEIVEIGMSDILDSLESKEKIVPDLKGVDIVWHPLCEDSIKSETVLANMLEINHLESVETQVYVKTENPSFVKTENIIQTENLNKTEDTSDENESWGNGQGVVEVQDSIEHFNALINLQTEEQLVLNFSSDLKHIGTSSRKTKHSKKIDFAWCYKTDATTSWEKEKEKIKVIKAPVIPAEPHEYISLAKDKHVCNHCQQVSKKLVNLKEHIKRMHRKVTTMYKCPYCPYKSKGSLQNHIIQKHKNAKDIQWFQCYLCDMKFKIKSHLTRHMKVHLIHNQMEDRSELCLVCGKRSTHKKREKRYCCRKCSKMRHLGYHCDKCGYKTYKFQHFVNHKLAHLKSEEMQYFHCYHCSYKSNRKNLLKSHIFRHFKNGDVPFHCYICDFIAPKRESIIEHIEKHSNS